MMGRDGGWSSIVCFSGEGRIGVWSNEMRYPMCGLYFVRVIVVMCAAVVRDGEEVFIR